MYKRQAHTFDVRAIDNAGNTGDSAQHAWDLDTVAPTVSVDSGPADNPTNSQNADFTFSASDAASGLSGTTCMLDTESGASACDQAAGSSYTSVAEGSRTYTVTATDDAGNSASATFTWYVDITDPSPSVDSGPSDPTNSNSATFTTSATDDYSLASKTCSLDGDSLNCGATTDNLAAGSHTFQVLAIDSAGNSATASYTWFIDNTDPTVSIDANPSDPSNDANPAFTVTSADEHSLASTTCDLDGSAVDCAGGAAVADGSHTFTATATDAAGNSASASYTWLVDITDPCLLYTSPSPRDLSTYRMPSSA